jgi:predicted PurR-regulated permease PerM
MLEVLTKTIQGVVYALCGLLLIYYLLLDGERLGRNLLELFPKASRPAMAYVFSSTHQVMFSFVKGQVLLGLLTGVYMFIVYTLIGVKYAAFLGSLFALAEILPVIGTYLGIIPGLTVALYTGGPLMALAVFLCSYAYQTVKDNILSPKIVGNVMGLHPVMVILSLLIFGKLGGLVGILFALPLASVFNVVLRACIHGIPRESGRPEAPSTLEANA